MFAQFVELFQSWQLLESPKCEFFKLLTIALFALAVGLLPYIDNWSHSKWINKSRVTMIHCLLPAAFSLCALQLVDLCLES